MSSPQDLNQNRQEHLLQHILFITKCKELHEEYNRIEDERPQFAETIEKIPTELPDNFLSLPIDELVFMMGQMAESEYTFYEKMEDIWGEDDRLNFELFWIDYDISIIEDYYFERQISKEEAYMNIIGMKQIKEAKEILSEMVHQAFKDEGEIPDDLIVFMRNDSHFLRNRIELCEVFSEQSTIALTQKLAYSLSNQFKILL
ncbi:hypothetical protein [Candidatus Lokiarchaeum ossiferum]|uniref:hypothetical protein n=1 Tax=Candidatus Lokiarchaeum ossiferum TaxID=2951803 RepID=UPI00352EF524